MVELVIGAAAALGMVAVAAWVVRPGGMLRTLRLPRATKQWIDLAEQDKAPKGRNDTVPREDTAAMEQSKFIFHDMLQNLSDSVESFHAENSKYGNALVRHRTAITKARTIAGIRELERLMLAELEGIQAANTRYRHQLDEANAKMKAQQEKLEKLQSDAGIDFLTGIPNRRSLNNRVAEELTRVKRYGGKFSLIILDVDDFKRVNDLYGHLAGDRVLRAMAQLLEGQKRASDFLARFGGEEFVLLLPETDVDRARVPAENTRKEMEQSTFRCNGHSVRITVSAGVGETLPEKDTPETLFARVDAALYSAKESGRNRVAVAPIPPQPGGESSE